VGRERLAQVLSHLVLPPDIAGQLGPAVNSARSILLYGDPGNGKTSIAEAIGKAFSDVIYLPYCIEVGGQIINFFDETVHIRAPKDEEAFQGLGEKTAPVDERWVACRRPVVLTGGELTLEMLDLVFNPLSRFYEAPLHLKAVGGVFIIDDFGRQRADPQTVLNRWIVPLERGYDYLTLHTGKKFAIPFDELVIFSTNIPPASLSDAGTLRRLYFKIKVPSPRFGEYFTIFQRVCADRGIDCQPELIERFFERYYRSQGQVPAGHHPKYLVDYAIAICDYRGAERRLDDELLDQGWHNIHVS